MEIFEKGVLASEGEYLPNSSSNDSIFPLQTDYQSP